MHLSNRKEKSATKKTQISCCSLVFILNSLSLEAEGQELVYRFDARHDQGDVAGLLRRLDEQGIAFRDLRTRESSLEEIFVDLVHNGRKGD